MAWSRRELARLAGVSEKSVENAEKSKRVYPKILALIARRLSLDYNSLIQQPKFNVVVKTNTAVDDDQIIGLMKLLQFIAQSHESIEVKLVKHTTEITIQLTEENINLLLAHLPNAKKHRGRTIRKAAAAGLLDGVFANKDDHAEYMLSLAMALASITEITIPADERFIDKSLSGKTLTL